MMEQEEKSTDPHLIGESRIRELEPSASLPAYRVACRCLDESDCERWHGELEALFDAFGRQRQVFLGMLFTRRDRALCLGSDWRKLRDRLVAGKYRSPFGLQARMWKMALQSASGTALAWWSLVQKRARNLIVWKAWFKKAKEAEKHYVRRLLSAPSRDFFALLDGKYPRCLAAEELKQIASRKGLCKAILRAVRLAQGRVPRNSRYSSVWFDCDCYRTAERGRDFVTLSLMTLTRGKRARIRVKGSVPVRGTVRLVRGPDGTIRLHVQYPVKPSSVKPLKVPQAPEGMVFCRALDLGFTEVATDDGGRAFGKGLGALLQDYAVWTDRKVAERNRLKAIAERAGRAKRRRMARCNLGEGRYHRTIELYRTRVRNVVNEALNRMFSESPAQVYVMEDLSHRFLFTGKFSMETRRMLSGWVRGVIRKRMLFKSALHGAGIAYVPCAYSSQRCPVCGYTARENRHGDTFECRCCGHRAQADENAARNLLERAGDSAFGRRMPKEEVLALENSRHEAWCRRRRKQSQTGPAAIPEAA